LAANAAADHRVRRASARRAPATKSWPRARLRLTLTREDEEQKPDSASGGCQQKHCSQGKDEDSVTSNEPLEHRGMLYARPVSTSILFNFVQLHLPVTR
jgi:hypothetical protein